MDQNRWLDLIALVPLLPACGALLNGLLGRKFFSRGAVHAIAIGTVALAFLLSLLAAFALLQLPPAERHFEQSLFTWFETGPVRGPGATGASFEIDWGYQLDPLSALMILVVTGVGLLIHIYSIGYMAHDPSPQRFFCYMNLFMFAMLTLVLANNYMLMFLGWEGVGLCSYLLIGFWFHKKSAADAGKKAFVVNRIGDFGFMLGAMLIFATFGSFDYTEVLGRAPEVLGAAPGVATAIGLLLFVGACGKSAQLPLYVWLPDAMEGPTPVSALIHAATMVTAGVYMVARSAVIYLLSPTAMLTVLLIGAATALFAATIGLVQNDIKRVLAYSTVSQLGYMFVACGAGLFAAGIFHLMTHAFFKALLFLGAGSVIHGMHEEQDLRRMGGLKRHMPWTWGVMGVACLAIAGIPGLAGFFSKDSILAAAFAGHTDYHKLAWAIGFLTAGLTAFYMFRLFFMTFYGAERFDHHKPHPHESPWVMIGPLLILALGSVVAGYVGVPHFLGGHFSVGEFLEPAILGEALPAELRPELHLSAQVEWILTIATTLWALLMIGLALRFYVNKPERAAALAARFPALHRLLLDKYRVDELYDATIVNPYKATCTGLWKFDDWVVDGTLVGFTSWATKRLSGLSILFDGGFVDGLVNLVGYLCRLGGRGLRRAQTGLVQNYALAVVFGLVALAGFYLFWS
ncbi:MAG TPA: NADH-quinone oxidoreductase subunit L [Acidobacteriota bacterium]